MAWRIGKLEQKVNDKSGKAFFNGGIMGEPLKGNLGVKKEEDKKTIFLFAEGVGELKGFLKSKTNKETGEEFFTGTYRLLKIKANWEKDDKDTLSVALDVKTINYILDQRAKKREEKALAESEQELRKEIDQALDESGGVEENNT